MAGYFGCVDMYVLKNFDNLFEIFRGPSFTDYYLNSPVQSRLSATCYATVGSSLSVDIRYYLSPFL